MQLDKLYKVPNSISNEDTITKEDTSFNQFMK